MASGWHSWASARARSTSIASPPTAAPSSNSPPGHLRRRHRVQPRRQVDLLQLQPLRQLARLAHAGRWRRPRRCQGEQITSDESKTGFRTFRRMENTCWCFLSQGHKTHNDRMDGVVLRLMPAPGEKLEPAKLDILLRFYGGQGTINVNSWSPDSRQFAFVVYEPLPAAKP